jgi:hypothetical protein
MASQASEMDVLPKWRRSELRIMQKVSFRKKRLNKKGNTLECSLLLPAYTENHLFAPCTPLICTLCPPDSSFSEVVLQHSFRRKIAVYEKTSATA